MSDNADNTEQLISHNISLSVSCVSGSASVGLFWSSSALQESLLRLATQECPGMSYLMGSGCIELVYGKLA